jgi:hypothetical protein
MYNTFWQFIQTLKYEWVKYPEFLLLLSPQYLKKMSKGTGHIVYVQGFPWEEV